MCRTGKNSSVGWSLLPSPPDTCTCTPLSVHTRCDQSTCSTRGAPLEPCGVMCTAMGPSAVRSTNRLTLAGEQVHSAPSAARGSLHTWQHRFRDATSVSEACNASMWLGRLGRDPTACWHRTRGYHACTMSSTSLLQTRRSTYSGTFSLLNTMVAVLCVHAARLCSAVLYRRASSLTCRRVVGGRDGGCECAW